MIRFRQKEFFLNALMAATSLIGVGQGAKANKIAEQQGNAQLEEQKRMNDAQLRLQKQEMKMQQQAQQKAQQNAMKMAKAQMIKPKIFTQKEFANAAMFRPIANVAKKALNSGTAKKIMSTDFYKNASGFAKDVYKVGKASGTGKKALGMAATGATMAGAGYLVDKAIQTDAKKSGIPIDPGQNVEEPKKKGSTAKKVALGVLGTGAAIGTGLALGKRGKLNMDTLKKAGNSVKAALKEQVIKGPASAKSINDARVALDAKIATGKMSQREIARATKKIDAMGKSHLNVGNLAFTGAFAAMPAISYMNQKKQVQEQTKEYAIPASGSIMKGVGAALKNAGKFAKKTTKGAVDWLSFGAGRKAQVEVGQKLAQQAASSGNAWSKKAANFLTTNKSQAERALKVGGGLALGSTVMFAPWTMGENATKKAIGVVDKNAYAYEKSQNKQVQ